MKREQVIRHLCGTVGLVQTMGDGVFASDCFCDEGDMNDAYFQHEGKTLDFVREAVIEKLLRRGNNPDTVNQIVRELIAHEERRSVADKTALDEEVNEGLCLFETEDEDTVEPGFIDRGFMRNDIISTRAENPPLYRCSCGACVTLSDAMTNECEKCGQLYNGSGQRLRPEHEWEENMEEY